MKRYRDADGDVWEECGDGEWVELKYHNRLPSLEVLEQLWGPLTEVDEA